MEGIKVKKQEIYNKVLSSAKNVTKHGQLNEKVLLSLQMTTSLYEHIEIVVNYYDDETRPDFNTWVDVEGMGYGWAWSRYEEDRWHEMMSKMVSREAKSLLKSMDITYFLICSDEKQQVYHFITIDGNYRYDTIITFSDQELFY